MVDIQLDTNLTIALVAAAVGIYIFTVRQADETIGDLVVDPLTRAADTTEEAVGTFYQDFIEPLSPAAAGRQLRRFGSFIGRRF